MISLKEKELLGADNSAKIFNILSTLPSSLDDVDTLLKVWCNNIFVCIESIALLGVLETYPIVETCSYVLLISITGYGRMFKYEFNYRCNY